MEVTPQRGFPALPATAREAQPREAHGASVPGGVRLAERISTRSVLGVELAHTDYGETMDVMDGLVARGERGYVCAVAVHAVMVARQDPEMADALANSTLTVPDGMPLVWAMNLLGHDLNERVYGPELMKRYNARCVEKGHRVWLYGGRDQGSLAQLALNMRHENPGIQIVGGYSPPFRPLTEDEEQWVVDDINRTKADVVWVGIGQPKQEVWMREMRDRVDAPMLVGVGAAFDFHAGLVPQAPAWMQTVGLEWAFRLLQEPRRLWRRYARYNPRFVAGFARQYTGARMRRR
jgi:N-acetylglucosaminyldiphosphoundecaprenol N-acetyl-beta-D-mannosaminyltransferase